ncbi:replication protein A 70 kDa DNA-binding subunit-like isoform X2 [Amphiura filiformis]|uniref:replication protein A 70 kDa DNA-binding subunit-like isoform X2 n=1 Tax=Amphiura filiformis TaxID=82378 RepID=UPI003B22037A
MSHLLTRGAIKEIADGQDYTKPVFQLLALKKLSANSSSGSGATDRYRLLLSDGVHSNSAMLAVQLNKLVDDSTMELFSVIQLDRFVCNPLPDNRRVMIVLEVSILQPGSQVKNKIGNPISLAQANQQQKGGNAAPMGQNLGRPSSTGSGGSGYGGSFANAMVGGSGMGSPPKKAQPINSLTPYQNRWTIKARISNKSTIRTWSNSKGEGKLFSMDLVDTSGEIRCTAFRDQVDKFYDMLDIGKIYYVSKGTLKPANKQYTSIQNDYEMVLNQETTISPAEEDAETSAIPKIAYDFRTIAQLEEIAKDTMIDIIGVVKSTGDVTTITTRATNREVSKRELQLLDETNKVVNLTLWGKEAEDFNHPDNPILAVKGARVSDFGGRSLSVLQSSLMEVNPDIPKAHQLKGWYDNEGCHQDAQSISDQRGGGGGGGTNWLSLAEVRNQNLGQGEKADYFTTKGTVIFLRKENCMYMACPSPDCNKKVLENGDGTYRCEKCDKEHQTFKYRLLLSANVADATETQWVTCFQDTAEAILGQKADYIGNIRDQDEAAFNQVFQDASFKPYIFKMRVKMETYNDEARLKCTCVNAQPLDYKEYSKKLIMDIRNLAQS